MTDKRCGFGNISITIKLAVCIYISYTIRERIRYTLLGDNAIVVWAQTLKVNVRYDIVIITMFSND